MISCLPVVLSEVGRLLQTIFRQYIFPVTLFFLPKSEVKLWFWLKTSISCRETKSSSFLHCFLTSSHRCHLCVTLFSPVLSFFVVCNTKPKVIPCFALGLQKQNKTKVLNKR
ncbi:hypothetical protein AMTRI_Chr06g175200 [Amborella trichopoda]